MDKKISVVIPIFDEEDNIKVLYERTKAVLNELYPKHEIIFVDDGSRDQSFSMLKKIASQDKKVKVIKFERNFGQTAAMMAGIQIAKGTTIVTMDGDLQNDPADIPALIIELQKGYDLVCGWRKDRKDLFWRRKLPSWFANKLISWFSGVHNIHDYGCTIRAYTSKSIKAVKLYGEMHRFIPIIIAWEGRRVTEIVVQHHPRRKGITKYGLERTFKVLLDLFLLKFMSSYTTRPIHFFGIFGILSIGIGGLVGMYTLYMRFIQGLPGINLLTLVLLTMFLLLIGGQTVLLGLLAEIGIRTYYETQDKQIYSIEQIINGDA